MGHQDDGLSSIAKSVLDGWDSTNNTLAVGDLELFIKGDIEVDLKRDDVSSPMRISWVK